MIRQTAIIYIGGSYPQIFCIKAARDAGHLVVLTDRDSRSPGKKYADLFFEVNATDIDGLLSVAERVAADYQLVACYGVADYAFDAIGAINERFKLPGGSFDVYQRCSNKKLAKQAWRTSGLPTADAVYWTGDLSDQVAINQLFSTLQCPVIIKPTDSYNGKGVSLLDIPGETILKQALKKASTYGSGVLLESYLKGIHCNVDVLMVKNKAYPVAITERWFSDKAGCIAFCGIQSSDLGATSDSLYRLAESAAQALGLAEGPITLDCVITGDGPVLLELSPHFHSVSTLYWSRCGNGFKAWFSYLAGYSNWQEYLLAPVEKVAAYVNFQKSWKDVVNLLKPYQATLQEMDHEERKTSLGRPYTIVWLVGDNAAHFRNALEKLHAHCIGLVLKNESITL